MTTITARKGVAEKVVKKVKDGICLVCDESAKVRGLCENHYREFFRRMREKDTPEAQAKFEENGIKEGLILPVQQARAIRRDDPFAKCE